MVTGARDNKMYLGCLIALAFLRLPFFAFRILFSEVYIEILIVIRGGHPSKFKLGIAGLLAFTPWSASYL